MLINEIGEIAVDHLLVRTAEETVVALESGCLCCTVRGEFVVSLEQLLRARDNCRVTAFRQLVVETTGAADPVPMLQSVLGHPYLSLRFAPLSVVTVVDAVNGLSTLDRFEEARRQVALADGIYLSKGDLSPDTDALLGRIAEISPAARPVSDLSALRFPSSDAAGRLAAELARYPADAAPVHASDVRSFTMTSEARLSPHAFALFMTLLRGVHGPNLLRLKGFVALSDDPERPVLLHGAQQVFHPPVRLDAWPDDDRRTRLVIVGKAMSPADIEAIYAAFA